MTSDRREVVGNQVSRTGRAVPVETAGAESAVTPQLSRRMAARGRLRTNLAANLAGFAISVAIGLWYTPFLIHHLGAAAYGIVPLVTAITGYMTILATALNAAVARYVTIELEKGDSKTASEYFNSSLFGSLSLAAALLLPAIWASLHVELLINVPASQLAHTRWLFICAAGAFMLSMIQTPFGVSTYSLNRFELRKALELSRQIVSVVVVLILFRLVSPQLWAVGLGIVAGTAVSFAGAVWFWRVLTPGLRVSVSHVTMHAVRGLTSMGGWMSINSIGTLLFLAIDLLVINRLFGPESGGRYAAVMVWSNLLRSIAGVMSDVFAPSVLVLYARNDIDGLVAYMRRSMKCVGLMIALPIGGICGLGEPLLRTWLGPGFADLAWLLTLMTIHLSVNLAVLPLFCIQTATKHVRLPGLVTVAMGVANLGLALLLAGPVGWGMYGVAAAGAIVLTSKNLLFTPVYAARLLKRRPLSFLSEALPIIAAALATVVACKVLAATWDLATWPRLALCGVAVGGLYSALVFRLLLGAEERKVIRQMLSFSRTAGGQV